MLHKLGTGIFHAAVQAPLGFAFGLLGNRLPGFGSSRGVRGRGFRAFGRDLRGSNVVDGGLGQDFMSCVFFSFFWASVLAARKM